MNYGQTIKKVRVERMRQKQYQFADAVGVSRAYLCLLESGKKKPSLDMLERIAEHVFLPLPVLFLGCLSEDSISDHKIDSYRQLRPVLDSLIDSLFDAKQNKR